MAKELGMSSMPMPSGTIGDHLTEYITLLAMLAATSSKIAREVYTLMKQEFGELEEPVPVGRRRFFYYAPKAEPSSLSGRCRLGC